MYLYIYIHVCIYKFLCICVYFTYILHILKFISHHRTDVFFVMSNFTDSQGEWVSGGSRQTKSFGER